MHRQHCHQADHQRNRYVLGEFHVWKSKRKKETEKNEHGHQENTVAQDTVPAHAQYAVDGGVNDHQRRHREYPQEHSLHNDLFRGQAGYRDDREQQRSEHAGHDQPAVGIEILLLVIALERFLMLANSLRKQAVVAANDVDFIVSAGEKSIQNLLFAGRKRRHG